MTGACDFKISLASSKLPVFFPRKKCIRAITRFEITVTREVKKFVAITFRAVGLWMEELVRPEMPLWSDF